MTVATAPSAGIGKFLICASAPGSGPGDGRAGRRDGRTQVPYGSRMDEPTPLASIGSPHRTARLALRSYAPGDLAAFHDLFSREDVCRYIPFGPLDLDQARSMLERRVRQTRIAADGDALLFAAADAATGRMVGEFMLRLTSGGSRQGEIGWALHPDVQGRGLATEGARELLRVGFVELGLHRITAACDLRHTASVRVMERLGMRREAEFVENDFFKGEWTGEIVCAILESEWRRDAGA
jgi:RimJ/RimL family protein N-acetyltransferase